jgi:threonine dehydratase
LLSAKLLAEPAGAAATAAVMTRAIPLRDGERVAAVVSGGNVDIPKLTGILVTNKRAELTKSGTNEDRG